MVNVLVAIPYKPNLHDHLYYRMVELSERLPEANPDYQLEIQRVCERFEFTGEEPYAHPQATARNALLDKHLRPEHDLVMWLDADLIDYPADIITALNDANPGGLTAPVVKIEGGEQFYDTYGFVQCGSKARPFAPFFSVQESLQLAWMDAVGTAYLAPASIYRPGRYTTTPQQTEHYSICQEAKRQGVRVACYTGMTIYHADLPRYGLAWHGH